MTIRISRLCLVAALGLGTVALAQERGRTDGPEGSEYGKGGYERAGGGTFSLSADWGASLGMDSLSSARTFPLFAGLTAGFWWDDWFVVDLSGAYLWNANGYNVLIGPRFRTAAFPIGLSAGLKAGAFVLPGRSPVHFALSPQIGADMIFRRGFLLGLNYALDLPIGLPAINNRVYLTLGYRF